MTSFNAFTPLHIVLLALSLGTIILEVVALIDAARAHSQAFVLAGKQTKQIWLIILSVALLFTLLGGFLSIFALIAALVYLIDVRPAVRSGRPRNDGQRMGPYGPW